MKPFLLILFFCFFHTFVKAQNEYDGNEYDCLEYESVCKTVHTFRVFPNPARDIVTIEGIENFCIYTVLGQFVGQFKSGEIDVSNWVQGIYFARNSTRQTVKFIKE